MKKLLIAALIIAMPMLCLGGPPGMPRLIIGTDVLAPDGDGSSLTGVLHNIVEDTTPQLGGNLDIQSNTIEGVDATEFGYLDGVTSDIQTQIDAKQDTLTDPFAFDGAVTINDSGADKDFRIEGSGKANALFVQGSDGYVGVNTSTPSYPLTALCNATNNAGLNPQLYSKTSLNSATANINSWARSATGATGQVAPSSGAANVSYSAGIMGVSSGGALGSTMGSTTALLGQVGSYYDGTVTTAYGLYIDMLSGSPNPTNTYGVYIDTGVGTTNKYGIYQAGTADDNYLLGPTYINNTLSVSGEVDVEGIAIDNIDIDGSTISTTSGNLTINPAGELSVSGNSNLNGSVIANGSQANKNFRVAASGQANALFVRGSDGYVGLLTNSPDAQLDVVTDIQLSAADDDHGGYLRKVYYATSGTLTGATDTIAINVPSDWLIKQCQLHVKTAVTDDGGDDTWDAELYDGATEEAIGTAFAAAQNTNVNHWADADWAGTLTDATTYILLTPNGGSFTAGEIEATCLAEGFVAWTNE